MELNPFSAYPRDDVVLVCRGEELSGVLDDHRPVGGSKLNLVKLVSMNYTPRQYPGSKD